MGRKFDVLGVQKKNFFNPDHETPRKSIPTETHHLEQKRCQSMQKCGL